MSIVHRLDGWDIGVRKRKFTEKGKNGESVEIEGFVFVFTEKHPPTGNQILFECRREIADAVVRSITGVIMPGLEFPNL